MTGIKHLLSTAVPLAINNIDTDKIVPVNSISIHNRKGYEKKLFGHWRYHNDGSLNDDFILNNDAYFGKILIAGSNFGGGKYTEQAVWAIHDYGFKAVISSSFNKNFKHKALNNNVLTVEISEDFLETLLHKTTSNPKSLILVDFEKQIVTLKDTNQSEKFEFN